MTDYRAFILSKFNAYKCKGPRDALIQLPVRDDSGNLVAFMKPVIQEWRVTDAHLAELLTRWREENPTISTGKFKATAERTATWLDKLIVGRDDRLMFMLNDPQGAPIGHLGYSNFDYPNECGEIDSVLRGVKEGYPGIMVLATRTLVAFGLKDLAMRDVKLSVFSDNEHAVRFYERFGFVKALSKPLYKVFLQDEEKWEIAPDDYKGPIEKYYLTMVFDKSRMAQWATGKA
jgi:RimJ/RimL family protein N-acetyltransferase